MRLVVPETAIVAADDRVAWLRWSAEWRGGDQVAAERDVTVMLRELGGALDHAELTGSMDRLQDEVRRTLRFRGDEVGEVAVELTEPAPRPAYEPTPPQTGDPVGPVRFAWPVTVVPAARAAVLLRGGRPVRELEAGLHTLVPGRMRLVDLREHVVVTDAVTAHYAVTGPLALLQAGIDDLPEAIRRLLPATAAGGDEELWDIRGRVDEATRPWGVRINRVAADQPSTEGARP